MNVYDQKNEAPLTHYRDHFRQSDPAALSIACGVPFDADRSTFSLTLLNRPFRIRWPEFALLNPDGSVASDKSARTSPAAQILLIEYLLSAKSAPGSGRFLSYREMPWGGVYDANFQGRCIQRLAFSFGARLTAFSSAMEKLCATRIDMGDAGFELPFLGAHRLRAAIWAADDEFPPSAQILFSDDFALAFTAEDMAVVGDVLIGTLTELAR